MKKLIPLLILCLLITVAPATECSAQRKKKDKIEMPQYPGGEAALHNYIKSELKYPHEANVNKESGEVIASNMDLFLGNVGGCIGEVSALAILIGFVYLLIRKVILPTIPLHPEYQLLFQRENL